MLNENNIAKVLDLTSNLQPQASCRPYHWISPATPAHMTNEFTHPDLCPTLHPLLKVGHLLLHPNSHLASYFTKKMTVIRTSSNILLPNIWIWHLCPFICVLLYMGKRFQVPILVQHPHCALQPAPSALLISHHVLPYFDRYCQPFHV